MVKVFLVEDEVIVREGIKNNIPWEEHGLIFCGEASDGELAYPMIQNLKPDIVITDIKMPFMDGLELSALIKKEFPWMEIIILSGFEEFDYAKKAINVGVSRYLTKPISAEDLLNEVDLLATRIEEARSEKALIEQYQREMEENRVEARKSLLHNIISGNKSPQELLTQASELSIDLSAPFYNMIIINFYSENHAKEEYSNSVMLTTSRILDLLKETDVILFSRNTEGKVLLVKADSVEELDRKIQMLIDRMQEVFKDYPQISYFGGIGKPVSRLHELPISFGEASKAYAHRYLLNRNMFLYSKCLMESQIQPKDEFNISDVDTARIDKQQIIRFLKTGNADEIIYFVSEFFMNIGEDAINSMMLRQYIAMDSYFAVVGFMKELEIEEEQYKKDIEFSAECVSSPERVRQYIVDMLTKAIGLRDNAASSRYHDIVDEAVDFIKNNYGDDELSLNQLASIVNVSPSHLSMIFSQEIGVTFIKYLTDYRLKRAKELLKCTNKRSSEVATEVGYKDPHYFSFIFKKTLGMTPTQYRGRKEQEGEE